MTSYVTYVCDNFCPNSGELLDKESDSHANIERMQNGGGHLIYLYRRTSTALDKTMFKVGEDEMPG